MACLRKPSLTENTATFLAGLAVGAVAMYALDPEGGRRRRALARDKTVHAAHRAGDALGSRSRDLANRAKGALSETRSFIRRPPAPASPADRESEA